MNPNGETTIWVTSQFVGFHRWKDAPEDVKFLREYHRHIFHVKIHILVNHDNRQVEFFQLKRKLDCYLAAYWQETYFEFSCEQIARKLCEEFNACMVVVSEDNENGATLLITKD